MLRTSNEPYRQHATQVQSTFGWSSTRLLCPNCSSVLHRVNQKTGLSNSTWFSYGTASPYFVSTTWPQRHLIRWRFTVCIYRKRLLIRKKTKHQFWKPLHDNNSIINLIRKPSHVKLRKRVAKNLAAICYPKLCHNYEKWMFQYTVVTWTQTSIHKMFLQFCLLLLNLLFSYC